MRHVAQVTFPSSRAVTKTKLNRSQITGFWARMGRLDARRHGLGDLRAGSQSRAHRIAAEVRASRPRLPTWGLPDRFCSRSSWWDGDCR